MEQMQIFNNSEFGNVRTIEEDGKVLFCGKDIAAALGYAIPRKAVREHCRGGLKRTGVSYTTNQYGVVSEQTVEMTYIPEGDVYRLITRSKLPTAEKFERWVFDEVLPTIRKTGGYGKASSQYTGNIEELITKITVAVVKELVPALMVSILPPIIEAVKAASEQVSKHRLNTDIGECNLGAYSESNMSPTDCKLERFPREVRNEVDEMLCQMVDAQTLNLSKIARFCVVRGYPISQPSVKKYYLRQFEGI